MLLAQLVGKIEEKKNLWIELNQTASADMLRCVESEFYKLFGVMR
jgi:hypothetical protein